MNCKVGKFYETFVPRCLFFLKFVSKIYRGASPKT